MEEKRRKTKNTLSCLIPIHELIGIETGSSVSEWITKKQYKILPELGRGTIEVYTFEDIYISIKKLSLENDLILSMNNDYEGKHLSFLIKGETILTNSRNGNEYIYADQDSYLLNFTNFKGDIKVSGGKIHHEVNIKLSDEFLLKHDLNNDTFFKRIGDPDGHVIIPMTNELYSIISDVTKRAYKGISYKIFLESKILELIAIQIDNYKTRKNIGVKVNTSCTIKKLYSITQILRERMNENLSIKSLCKEVGLNEYILKKEFKRVFGTSVGAYALKVKMQKAKELLEGTEVPIYEISETIGYKNATHFSAAFKRFHGISPKKLRDRL